MIFKLPLVIFASLGFSLIINANPKHYTAAALLGGASFLMQNAILKIYGSILLTSLISAMIACVLSQISARIKKAPAVCFLLPSILPLVPGKVFFYAISLAITQNFDMALKYFSQTLEYSLGISVGIILGAFFCKILPFKSK